VTIAANGPAVFNGFAATAGDEKKLTVRISSNPALSCLMDVTNISKAKEWFQVLQTSDHAQTAMMTLAPGDSTGAKAEAHKHSEQILLVLEGELAGEVGDDRSNLRKGDVIMIPAGAKHRFTNRAEEPAVTFNVYAPPAYPSGSKG
jgi:mannose-6-phosphate isomerase-like protein (cupin superfamily)